MKGITDRLGVPRTQLAYVVNTMAAPVCLLIPLSSWAAYFAMLMENEGITVNGSGMGAYLKALPFTFYAYLAVIVCVLQIIGIIPKMGQIKKDYARYEATGDVFPGEQNASLSPGNHLRQLRRLKTHIFGIS